MTASTTVRSKLPAPVCTLIDMKQIPDDPIIREMERSGYPPWLQEGADDDGEERSEYDLILENFWLEFVKVRHENNSEGEAEDGVSL